MGDLSSIRTVVHQQKVEFTDVGDDELAETIGQEITGLLGRTVTDLGHRSLTLETSTHVTIDTLGLSPRFTNTHETVRLVTLEGSSTLLHDGVLYGRSDHF